MKISRVIVGILVLILYIGVFIPLILPHITILFIDWVNNSGDMFVQQFCVVRQVYNQSTNQFDSIAECTQYDFRPLIVFVFQLAIYFAIPLILLFGVFKR
jgi:hypothetical protein